MNGGAAPRSVAVDGQELESLQRNVAEEIRHRLAVVGPADGLGEDHGNVNDLRRTANDMLRKHA